MPIPRSPDRDRNRFGQNAQRQRYLRAVCRHSKGLVAIELRLDRFAMLVDLLSIKRDVIPGESASYAVRQRTRPRRAWQRRVQIQSKIFHDVRGDLERQRAVWIVGDVVSRGGRGHSRAAYRVSGRPGSDSRRASELPQLTPSGAFGESCRSSTLDGASWRVTV